MNIVAIGGSNSKNSINRQLANFTAKLFENAAITTIDISSLSVPMYSVDTEASIGIPQEISAFAQQIDETDLIVLSLAENNGSFNVGLKNLLDWTSRIKGRPTFNGKPVLLMATSPGARGGASVLESGKNLFPYSGAKIVGTFSLPEFYKNFDPQTGISNEALLQDLKSVVHNVTEAL